MAAHRQGGMTLIGVVLVLAVIGLALLVAIRLVPVYIEAYSIGSVLSDMESESRMSAGSRGELRDTFSRRLQVNDIESVGSSDLEFREVAGGVEMFVEYEVRVDLLGNIDLVASFRRDAVIRN